MAPLPSCSGTRMSESLCRCTFYLRLKLLATKLHHLFQITKSVFGRLPTSNQAFLLRRKDVTALRCSEPLRSKVGGPSKVYSRFCGMGPPDYDLYHIFYMLCSESHYLSVNDFLSKFVQSSFIPILYNLLFLCI